MHLIGTAFAWFFSFIAGLIYDLFRYVYRVFNLVASAKLVNNDFYRSLARNIYVLIGVVALFLAAYSLLTAIADPEGAAKSKNSPVKLVQNVLITIVLIAFVPTIFNFAYNVQGIIMQNNVIGQILDVDASNVNDNKTFSGDFAFTIWDMFYKTKPANTDPSTIFPSKLGPNSENPSSNLEETQNQVKDENNPASFVDFSKYCGAIADDKIEVDWLALIGMGCACVYLFVSFSIDMGVRAIKLAFYQIIAPIPILSRIIPGQNKVFDNWLKGTMSTFFEVFIRVGAVTLGAVLINYIYDWNLTWVTDMSGITETMKSYAKITLIIGILIFVKQAPKFIGDLFGIQSGSFKLGIADKLGEMAGVGTFAKDTLNSAKGAAAGALGAGYQAAWSHGNIKKALKAGAAQGWKGKGFGQFNAQRQATYTLEGGKGQVGLFGRRAVMDKAADDTKNAYNDDYKDRVLSSRVNAQTDFRDKNSRYGSIYQKTVDNMDAQNKAKMESLSSDIAEAKNQFDSALRMYYKRRTEDIARLDKEIEQKQQYNDEHKNEAGFVAFNVDALKREREEIYDSISATKLKQTFSDSEEGRALLSKEKEAIDSFQRARDYSNLKNHHITRQVGVTDPTTGRTKLVEKTMNLHYDAKNMKADDARTWDYFSEEDFYATLRGKENEHTHKEFTDEEIYKEYQKAMAASAVSELEAAADTASTRSLRDADEQFSHEYQVFNDRVQEKKTKAYLASEQGIKDVAVLTAAQKKNAAAGSSGHGASSGGSGGSGDKK